MIIPDGSKKQGKKYQVAMEIFKGQIHNHRTMKFAPHKSLEIYKEQLRRDIQDALNRGETHDSLGALCHTSGETIGRIVGGKRGKNVSLDIALKIWDGLGILSERLGCVLPPDATAKVKKLGQDEMDLLMKFVDLLSYKEVVPSALMGALAGTITALHSEAVKNLTKVGGALQIAVVEKIKN